MGFLRYEELDLGELIAEAQDPSRRDDRALGKIIRQFEPLVRKIGRTMANGKPYRDDVENAARLGLTRAVARHRGLVETFPAYAKLHMRGAARRELARWSEPDKWSLLELDELRNYDLTAGDLVEEAVDHHSWGFGDTADAIAGLRPDQQRLVTRRYMDRAGLAEIAAENACSVPAVSQRLTTIHRRLAGALAA